MTIATITLSWEYTPSRHGGGWRVEIDGLCPDQKEDFRLRFRAIDSPYGSCSLIITRREEVLFAQKTAEMGKPPMHVVVLYLNKLSEMGYDVVASTSHATHDGKYYEFTAIWTLNMTD